MNKVALVTGGTSGLGLQLISKLTERGYKVYSLSRNRNMIDSLRIKYPTVEFMCGDITSEQDISITVQTITSNEGRLDVLVNNAGIIYPGGIEQLNYDEWRKMFEVNVNGVFLLTQKFLSLLKKTSDSCIINISSISSKMTGSSMAYSASKAAIDMMTKSLAKELAQYGIRVNSVNPGIMDTGFQVHNHLMNDEQYPGFLENVEKTYPLGIGTANDVSNLILFLVSDEAKWITGSNYIIDGGRSVNI